MYAQIELRCEIIDLLNSYFNNFSGWVVDIPFGNLVNMHLDTFMRLVRYNKSQVVLVSTQLETAARVRDFLESYVGVFNPFTVHIRIYRMPQFVLIRYDDEARAANDIHPRVWMHQRRLHPIEHRVLV